METTPHSLPAMISLHQKQQLPSLRGVYPYLSVVQCCNSGCNSGKGRTISPPHSSLRGCAATPRISPLDACRHFSNLTSLFCLPATAAGATDAELATLVIREEETFHEDDWVAALLYGFGQLEGELPEAYDFVAPSFPPHYNIFDSIFQMYHIQFAQVSGMQALEALSTCIHPKHPCFGV